MTARASPDPKPARSVVPALARGIRGRCPRCGKGRILSGYIRPNARCAACGEDLSSYRTADFAPYLVTFVIGAIFTPLTVVFSMSADANAWVVAALTVAALARSYSRKLVTR